MMNKRKERRLKNTKKRDEWKKKQILVLKKKEERVTEQINRRVKCLKMVNTTKHLHASLDMQKPKYLSN